MNPKHLSMSAEHYTPEYVVEAARRTLQGKIDLDPASCHAANEVVKARKYYTRTDSGLKNPWEGNLFINPPGDCGRGPDGLYEECRNQKRCGCKLPLRFWQRLEEEFNPHNPQSPLGVKAFVWVGFNISHLRMLQQNKRINMLRHCDICIPAKRISFTGNSPTQDNVIIYGGPKPVSFQINFAPIGQIWKRDGAC